MSEVKVFARWELCQRPHLSSEGSWINSSMRSAASRLSCGITCEYVSIVIANSEWPSMSMTTLGDTPCTNSNVAQE